jgi:hypothetical protein
VKTVLFASALSVLLALPSHAQQFPETERQKKPKRTAIGRKRLARRRTSRRLMRTTNR